MRIYIIGDDGITLCREPPAAMNEGEVVVASNEELHAARLSGKRLLALWNALPDFEKRKKVGDRDALVDELWSAICLHGGLLELKSEILGPRAAPKRRSASPASGTCWSSEQPAGTVGDLRFSAKQPGVGRAPRQDEEK
jgi:hypothetical protein